MVPDAFKGTPDYQAINDRKPGGAITCPYCGQGVEYHPNGEDLVRSTKVPLRYSRSKTEGRAKIFGQAFLNQSETTPEEWAAKDKGMIGAFRGYSYEEDP